MFSFENIVSEVTAMNQEVFDVIVNECE
jgi:hypothetical protein